jgi:hypothetical protein
MIDLARYHLERDVVHQALDWSRENHDPAEIVDDLADDGITAAAETLMSHVGGAPSHVAARMERHLFDDPCNTTHQGFGTVDRLDAIGARLMAHVGIDPLVLTWISNVTRSHCPMSDRGDGQVAEVGTRAIGEDSETSVALDDDSLWDCTGGVFVRSMPETVMVSAIGRPLADVLSHPVLDPLGMTISGIEVEPSGWISIQVDAKLEPVTTDELRNLSEQVREMRRETVCDPVG